MPLPRVHRRFLVRAPGGLLVAIVLLAGAAAAQVPDELDSVANARRATAPAMFILHGDDEVVPPEYQRRVAEAYAGPKRIVSVPGKHAAPRTREASAAVSEGRKWMWESSRGTSARSQGRSPQDPPPR